MSVIHLTSGTHKINLRHEVNSINLRHNANSLNLQHEVNSLNLRHEVNNLNLWHNLNKVVLRHTGRRGIPGVDKNYVLDFTNSDEVTVDHSLSKYPAVTITDTSGDEVMGDVEHVSVNQLIARFSNSFSGRIICN